MQKTVGIIATSLFFSTGSPVHAQQFESARMASLGGSGRAAPILNDALYTNPAYMSFLQVYSASYTWNPYQSAVKDADGNPNSKGRVYSASLQDGRSPLVAGGLGFSTGPDDSRVTVAVGKKISNRLGVGLNFRWSFDHPTAPSSKDFSLNGVFVVNPEILVSGGVDQIIASNTDENNGFLRSAWVGGKWSIMKMLMLYADFYHTPRNPAFGVAPWGHRLGVEIDLGGSIFLRLGQFRNARFSQARTQAAGGYGVGIGWIGPKLSTDYGLLRTTVAPLFPQTVSQHFSISLYL